MLSTRWLMMGALFTGSGGLALACGGSTSGGSAAAVELERNGSTLCADACETLVACGIGGRSCECTGSSDAAEPSCVCEEPSVESCTEGCTENVDEVLADSPGCADELLALIDCVTGATCAEAVCETAAERLGRCQDESERDEPDTKVPSLGGRVQCDEGFGSGSAAGPRPPGALVCEQGFGGCSDGSDYRVTCTATVDGKADCQCMIDGLTTGGYTADASCSEGADFLNEACGWNLAL